MTQGADVAEGPTDELLTVLDRLRLRAHRAARSQYLAGKRAQSYHFLLGVPATVLAALVSTAIFASLDTQADKIWVVLGGLISAVASVLAALQTLFGFSERSAKHRVAGGRYAALKRDLDVLALRLRMSETQLDEALTELQAYTSRFNEEEQKSPDVPDRLYDRARREQATDTEGI